MRKPITLVAATLVLAVAASAAPAPAPQAAPALLAAERGWLSKLENDAYDANVKANAAQAIANARMGIGEHLPADARAKYKRLTTPPINEIDLNTFLYNVVHLTPAEVSYFERKDPAALKAYQAKLAALQAPDHSLPLEKRDEAHKVVLHYRALTQTAARPRAGGPRATPTPTGAAVPLTARETAWLKPDEAAAYAAALKKTPLTKSDRLQILKKYRDALAAADLPEESRDGYKATLSAGVDAAKIDAYLLTIVELRSDEISALEKIVKGKEPAGYALTQADARKEYEGEMAPLSKEAGHTIPKETARAYAIAKKYRDMLKAAGAAPGTPPVATTPPTSTPASAGATLSDKEKNALTPEQKAAYDQEIAAAKGDAGKIADINQKYRRLAATRDIDVFNSLAPDAKKDVCAPYKNYVAGSGAAADAGAACTAPDLKPCLKQDKKGYDEKCVADLKAKCAATQGPAPATPSASLPPLDPKVRDACVALNQNLTPPQNTTPGPVTTTVPSPGSKPGTDKGPADKKKGFLEGMSKETSANVRAGVAGAVLGLLLGSFFGPGGMLIGALLGGGALFGANYALNKMP